MQVMSDVFLVPRTSHLAPRTSHLVPRTTIFLLLLCVSLTTAAGDIVRRGCRQASVSPDGTRRAESTGAVRQPGGDFYYGDRRQLVVLASFADRTFKGNEEETLTQWDKIFNLQGFHEEPFVGSVHDYFYAQSYGKFNLQFDLQYVQLSANHDKYGSTRANDENSQYLVQDVVAVLRTRDIDWNLYDWNGDGFVNQLLIIYAGKGSAYGGFGGGYDAIWPHQYWMTGHTDQETHEKCSALSVTGTDGKTLLVDSYCAVQELKSDDTYGAFGTLCHEFSHCFGFPDFYYGSTKYVGAWDIMDSSYYNNNGFCPSDYSAHERWLMGWLTPTELKGTTTVDNMPNLSEQGVAYLIRSEGNSNEYYMVENRQQKGWDAGLPGSGILIFHIDYDPALWVSITDAPNKSSRQHYVIIPANNKPEYTQSNAANWAYPYNGNTSLTNTSSPAATLFNANADGTMFMNKPLTDLAVDASGLASFSFTGGPTAVSLPSVLGPYKVLYDLGPIYIIRLANGEIMKVMKH